MPYEQHQEKHYVQDPGAVYRAALAAMEKLDGKAAACAPERAKLEMKLPKTMRGKVLGERTYLTCEARIEGGNTLVVVDAYPLDAIDRKLLFGARKGVTETAVTWFMEQLDQELA
jgi:hypothetical protein